MPVKEKSFRIGCGRYVQEAGALDGIGEEVLRLGHAPLIVGGPTALSLTRERIAASVTDCCKDFEIVEHPGTCNEERAGELAALAKERGLDVIVGVGGGVMMDFAKLCGHFAKLPVINVPTSSATCACYTPLSVRYTPEGRTVGSLHYDHEVNAVIVDTGILAKQPVRLLVAGVFDALAKFVEIRQRFDGDSERCPLGLDWAYVLATHSYSELINKTERCIADMARGEITPVVENVIFTTIAVTGVISGIARGSNQTALAHKFYETTRSMFREKARPYLHGEIVGVGLLLQNHFNGEVDKNDGMLSLMKKYGVPGCASEVGITVTEEALEEYHARLTKTSAIDETKSDETKRLTESLRYLWSLG